MCGSKGTNSLPNLLDFDNSLLQRRINRSYNGEEGRQAKQGTCHHHGRSFGEQKCKNEALALLASKSKSRATRKATSRHSDEAEIEAQEKSSQSDTAQARSRRNNARSQKANRPAAAVVAKQRGLVGTALSSYMNGIQTAPLSTHPTPTT